jgi:magnesium transporter
MINTLFLPELREMLETNNSQELSEFCMALHPARTAEFMEGLTAEETWQVLQHADASTQAEVFNYFDEDRQQTILRSEPESQLAKLFSSLSADDAVDLLQEVDEQRADAILSLVSASDRRDIRRLQSFEEGTAGSLMTTEAACFPENLSVREVLEKLQEQAEHLETIYYIYVTDETNHLRGVVSNRMLVSAIAKPNQTLGELMESDVVVVEADDDQEVVAQKVAKYNLLAIPVVDAQHHMLGIITHDDVMDVMQEEATEDFQRIAAVEPLDDSYLRTSLFTLSWKRGLWLTILFFAALLTAFALQSYESVLDEFKWLVCFIPLIISSGGNSGSQSSSLIIAGLATGDVVVGDWKRIIRREFLSGLILGGFLATIGYFSAMLLAPSYYDAWVIPITILFTVVCGTTIGSMLPLIFQRLGLDPALMSNPFVAGIIDILGIVIYINVAVLILVTLKGG